MMFAEIHGRFSRGLLIVFLAFDTFAGPPDCPCLDEEIENWVDPNFNYVPILQQTSQWIPSAGLPAGLKLRRSNNNVAITFFDDRLFLAFRSAPNHFASKKAKMIVLSSRDLGGSWDLEQEIALQTDVREPNFLVTDEFLVFSFFEAGKKATSFDPKRLWRLRRFPGFQNWGEREVWGEPKEIVWDIKNRKGRFYMTSYKGNHYKDGEPQIELRFKTSADGINWSSLTSQPSGKVYVGGVSESSFEFNSRGDLWAVTRNEDGDRTGFGGHLVTAAAHSLGEWMFPDRSDPHRYDSPRMFRHGNDLYLVARRDPKKVYDSADPGMAFDFRRMFNLGTYSLRPKRTALYKIDEANRQVMWLFDFPSAADTAFPSILRMGADDYWIANYSSPVEFAKKSWLFGQVHSRGTQIQLFQLHFDKLHRR